MTRINVTGRIGTDDYGNPATGLIGWFDLDKAVTYEEATDWDGQNRVSVNPGCAPYGHQRLHRTAGERWVLNSWSQWQGSPDIFEFISDDRVREWLLLNGHDKAVAEHFGPVEDERGPGRPEVGARVGVRLGEMLPAVDAYADGHGISRAEAIRRLIGRGLSVEVPVA